MRPLGRVIATSLAWLGLIEAVRAGDVTGRVTMPALCSPAISPAVVRLIPPSGSVVTPEVTGQADSAPMALIRQQALSFQPRVVPLAPGQGVEWTNQDPETHNIHVLGTPFSRSMAPGERLVYRPESPGVHRVVCDVHAHMRAYLVVSETPWIAAVDREGGFRIADVPGGSYTLNIWHEFGEPLVRAVEVGPGGLDLGTLALSGPATVSPSKTGGVKEPIRTWPEVIDRVSLTFAASLDAAGQPDGRKAARRLAEDAYYSEFEANGMEIAVGRYLGESVQGDLERRFRELIRSIGKLPGGGPVPAALSGDVGLLLMELNKAGEALNREGITDRSKIGRGDAALSIGASLPASEGSRGPLDLSDLRRAFDLVVEVADSGDRDDAASALSDAYFDAFEPIERRLLAVEPGTVLALEARFGALRGRIGAGLRGPELDSELGRLFADTEQAIARAEAPGVGTLGAAFLASLLTIVREGVEVILVLTMLLALVARTGRPGARRAILGGVAAGLLASLATAIALNRLVSASRAQVGELVEGLVMLAAALVLFYVSYWLISQAESRRWTDFLKRSVNESAAGGRLWALALTAFLAVYREGAETALLYQAMLGVHDSGEGRLGLGLGLGLGLVILGVLYWAIRKAGAKLPIRTFFSVSGALLFALAVIFAGKGVFELQQAAVLKVTPLPSVDFTLPLLGFYPNVQVAAVQGLMLIGAGLAWGLLLFADRPLAPTPASKPSGTPGGSSNPPTTVGAGV